jgi:ribosomal protein S18 acetylase RimI-like enzyme
MEETDFALCDFDNPEHCRALCDLLNMYMADPMGDYPQHDELQNRKLVDDMRRHPTSITLFVLGDGRPVGIVNAYMNYSTFKLQPFINIHDVFIMPAYRGRGLSRRLIAKMTEIARDNGCCKLTLEVRYDNPAAQACYRAEGFGEDEPPMHYWEKIF